jgi:luciferase family oxidoreductase group 1
MFAGLFGNRIDLAVGRAPGTDGTTMFALQRDRRQASPDDFPEQLAELLGYLGDTLPVAHPFARLAALPGLPGMPDPWLLGSSPQSGIWAAECGLPYAFADFINPSGAADAARYRQAFVPSRWRTAPELMVAVWVVCADTDAEARRLLQTREFWRVGFEKGLRQPLVTPEFAASYSYTDAERATIEGLRRKALVGTGDAVAARLTELAERLQLDELVVVTWTHDPAARHRSYELLAAACGLEPINRGGH